MRLGLVIGLMAGQPWSMQIYTSPSSISGYILYAILYNALYQERHTAWVTHSSDCK